MEKKFKVMISAGIISCVIGGIIPAFAADDAQLKLGMEVFMRKDAKKNACATCHPKGGTDGSIIDGKKVPNLKKTVAKMSNEKINEAVRFQAKKRVNIAFTENELVALVKFVAKLGGK